MSNINFMSQDSPESDYIAEQTNFELSDYFTFNKWFEDDQASTIFGSVQNPVYRANEVVESGGTSSSQVEGPSNSEGANNESGRERKLVKERVAFKTKSEVEILDDGFKWRKYGKKMVKNSPNPRFSNNFNI
uniref:WRKY transcription factor protein 18 n=1 Tax=Zanthoxylum armatum TaxID=67938 RepID=A0A8F1NNT8_9ROSI|nr:WRKY transcription factor protein 18 [Zanthoxylum armatum]